MLNVIHEQIWTVENVLIQCVLESTHQYKPGGGGGFNIAVDKILGHFKFQKQVYDK